MAAGLERGRLGESEAAYRRCLAAAEASGFYTRVVSGELVATVEAEAGPFSLALMIDVTQHIVDDAKFFATMKVINDALLPGGTFIVTSWLDAGKRDSYYEKSRDIGYYEKAFDGGSFSAPKSFADKFIFSIRKPETRA